MARSVLVLGVFVLIAAGGFGFAVLALTVRRIAQLIGAA